MLRRKGRRTRQWPFTETRFEKRLAAERQSRANPSVPSVSSLAKTLSVLIRVIRGYLCVFESLWLLICVNPRLKNLCLFV